MFRTIRRLGVVTGLLTCTYIYPWTPEFRQWPAWLKQCALPALYSDLGFGAAKTANPIANIMSSNTEKTISIIIPVYNDGKQVLKNTILSVFQNSKGARVELIIVDGGCKDDTMESLLDDNLSAYTQSIRSVKLDSSKGEYGRGCALRKGAAHAVGEVLVFLHADTLLPKDFSSQISECLDSSECFMAAFTFKIKANEVNSKDFSAVELFTNIRARYLWMPYGDQVFVISTQNYECLGGIRNLKLMEDFDFIWRAREYCLSSEKKIKILDSAAECSGKRWETNGVAKTSLSNWLFVFGYVVLGFEPSRLFEIYYK